MSTNIQTNQPIVCPNTNYTISAADSGKIMLIPAVLAERTYLLPNVASGLHYRFLVTPAAGLGFNVNLQPSLNGVVANGLINGTAIVNSAAAGESIKYNASNAVRVWATSVLGDYCDVYCDGTRWHVSAMSSVEGFD